MDTAATHEVLIDNDRVRVTRVTLPAGEVITAEDGRLDRVVIAVTGHRAVRREPHDSGELRTVVREPGDAVWRPASRHSVANATEDDQVVVIVELKG